MWVGGQGGEGVYLFVRVSTREAAVRLERPPASAGGDARVRGWRRVV